VCTIHIHSFNVFARPGGANGLKSPTVLDEWMGKPQYKYLAADRRAMPEDLLENNSINQVLMKG